MRIRVKKAINKIQVGAIVNVPIDKEGTPLDYFWRKIFKDTIYDDSIEILDKKNTIDDKISKSSER